MIRHHNIDSQTTRQSGFSLIEILITVAMTTVGLLGLASMQAAGLRNNQAAYHRSQATVLAYDIADRMRANTSAINNYLSSFMTLAQAKVAGASAGCKNTSGCTPAQMAQNDLFEWNAALTIAMPNTTGTIVVLGDIYTIDLSWDENRDGSVDSADPNFQLSFQP